MNQLFAVRKEFVAAAVDAQARFFKETMVAAVVARLVALVVVGAARGRQFAFQKHLSSSLLLLLLFVCLYE